MDVCVLEVTWRFIVCRSGVDSPSLIVADPSTEMKYILAAIYTNFITIIVNDEGIEQKDLYTAPPSGGKLIVKLEVAPV